MQLKPEKKGISNQSFGKYRFHLKIKCDENEFTAPAWHPLDGFSLKLYFCSKHKIHLF